MSSNEITKVIEDQIRLMEIDLDIVLTTLKVKEYRVKAEVLEARANIEEFKIRDLNLKRTKLDGKS